VGRQPKVLVPIVVAVLVAAGLALWRLGPIVAVGVLVVGGLLAAVAARRLADRGGSSTLDTLRDATAPDTAVPLEPWSPPEPLQPWRPPEPVEMTEPGWDDGVGWDDRDVAVDTNPLDELDRLEDLDVVAEVERLEATTFDEEIWETDLDAAGRDGHGAATTTSAFTVHRVNEDVHSAEDIMAASHATELSFSGGSGGGENSELAKLLAKVQARLAAYE
jgi:hypothetical protein